MLRAPDFHLCLAPLIYSHRAVFSESITPIAAPRPLLRLLDQPPLHRILMHIAQLLDPFARREHVEIIETFLPHVLCATLKQFPLSGHSPPAQRFQNTAREALFYRLHHARRIAHLRLADQ